ncbi:MAG: response regulator [Candidatus Parabeggiatoa sp.]|nr:response regulator [Candidatus Parabeggiatoa sp.]
METILIIDDMPFEVKLLSIFLNKMGFKVLAAYNGQKGIQAAELAQPDLILLDVVMPGIDGFEVCEKLKNHPKTQDIPIIFMTARSTEILDKIKGFELGAADYIAKPFEHQDVLARINTHLKLHHLQQQLRLQNQQLQEEVNRRKQAEKSLQEERNGLVERTVYLSEANAKLAHIARLKDEFLANMSHELRTPLNAILGISEALQEEIYGTLNDLQRKSMRTLEDSGRHLLALINDILDLSKIEAEKLTLQIGTVSVNQICQASLRMTKEVAYKKQIRVSTTIDYTLETMQADERRLKQILVNLLSNAIKFTPAGGSVKLEVTGDAEDGVVEFSVRDTGIGIAKEQIKDIFEPFMQLDGSLNRMQEGTGLGLSLVYRLTEMHGGSISIESEVDQGSCFTISLPWQQSDKSFNTLAIESDQPTSEPKSTGVKNSHPSELILLAEDQETTILMISDYLSALGYQIIVAQDGVEAVKLCKEKYPALILMDIQMPVMNGLDAIEEIRANTDTATIPIIALTALAMSGDRERCLKAGANEYLSKPVNLKELVATIERLLR